MNRMELVCSVDSEFLMYFCFLFMGNYIRDIVLMFLYFSIVIHRSVLLQKNMRRKYQIR